MSTHMNITNKFWNAAPIICGYMFAGDQRLGLASNRDISIPFKA